MTEDTSIKKLNELIEKRVDLDFDKLKKNEELKGINKQIGELDDSINQILRAAEMEKYSHPRATISLEIKESVKVPQNPEARELFFTWLKEEKLYDQYITVNSQSINSLFKKYKADLLNIAEASGDTEDLAKALNFVPPGIEPPNPYERVKVSGKKPKN